MSMSDKDDDDFDLDDLELPDFNEINIVKKEIKASTPSREPLVAYWINGEPLEEQSTEVVHEWVMKKFPWIKEESFSMTAFDTKGKRVTAFNKIVDVYQQVKFLFPRGASDCQSKYKQ